MWNLAIGSEYSLFKTRFVRGRTLSGRCSMLGKADFAFAIASSARERNWSEEKCLLAGKLPVA